MLTFNEKPLAELTMEECIAFEKSILKRVLAADSAGMSGDIQVQLNQYLETVRAQKQNKINEFVESSTKDKNIDDKYANGMTIGEDEQEQPDDIE
jgi:hypothetical protein|tara:strand:- start:3736 stop:4020 length:285 start_codon:yes stop_codon:yes gene_type:complete